jgi:hypothetical protein
MKNQYDLKYLRCIDFSNQAFYPNHTSKIFKLEEDYRVVKETEHGYEVIDSVKAIRYISKDTMTFMVANDGDLTPPMRAHFELIQPNLKTHQRAIILMVIRKGSDWIIHPASTLPGRDRGEFTNEHDVLLPGLGTIEKDLKDYVTERFNAVKLLSLKIIREVNNSVGGTCYDYEILAEVTAPSNSTFHTIADIKKAVDEGKPVYWGNKKYRVVKDSIGQYLIICGLNGHCIGLTNQEDTLLNGNIEEFLIEELM